MSIKIVKNPLGPVTTFTHSDLAWVAECMEIHADYIGDHADELEREAQFQMDHGASDAEEYEARARGKRDEHAHTVWLAEILATATQVDVHQEVAA